MSKVHIISARAHVHLYVHFESAHVHFLVHFQSAYVHIISARTHVHFGSAHVHFKSAHVHFEGCVRCTATFSTSHFSNPNLTLAPRR